MGAAAAFCAPVKAAAHWRADIGDACARRCGLRRPRVSHVPAPVVQTGARPRRGSTVRCAAHNADEPDASRRRFLIAAASSLLSAALAGVHPAPALDAPQVGYMSPSGLKYFDFVVGEGPKPKWGDFITLKYALYTIAPGGESLVTAENMFGTNRTLYVHHGNGQLVLGLEEALHSMRPGGRRRIIVPPEMGYVNPGLGPIPVTQRARKRFFEALRETGGVAVFDIEVVQIEKQESDPFGYYTDMTPSPDELYDIVTKAYMKGLERDSKADS